MLNYIQDIVTRFGGRYFGSEQEKNAQYFTAGILNEYCDKVAVEEFHSALESHFQSLKIFSLAYVAVLVLLRINIPVAAILGIMNTVLFLLHFVMYRHFIVDKLFPNKPSWNVIGDIEPLQEAKRTIIVAGHIDSVKEFKWWYKLKQKGAALTVLSGFVISFLGIYALLHLFIHVWWFYHIWLLFVLLTPMLVVFFNMHGNKVVDGASDNLTGVAMAVEAAKVFSANRLQHTRVRVISFGAEEAGLRGAWAYAQQHKEQLLKENAFLLNIDTIKDLEHLTIVTAELNTLVFYKKAFIKRIQRSFEAMGVKYKKLPVGVGASDGSAFHMNGLPVATIIGMDSGNLDPCYHTRLDTVDCINPEALEATKKVMIHFIETWDKE